MNGSEVYGNEEYSIPVDGMYVSTSIRFFGVSNSHCWLNDDVRVDQMSFEPTNVHTEDRGIGPLEDLLL